jgi:hypothetical protein
MPIDLAISKSLPADDWGLTPAHGILLYTRFVLASDNQTDSTV